MLLLSLYPDVMSYRISGLLAEQRDDAARQFVVYASDGSTVIATEAYDAAENAAATVRAAAAVAATNEQTLRNQAMQARATNDTFLGIASPTNAQIAAQVKALTRQNNGLIRLVLRRFDSTD